MKNVTRWRNRCGEKVENKHKNENISTEEWLSGMPGPQGYPGIINYPHNMVLIVLRSALKF